MSHISLDFPGEIASIVGSGRGFAPRAIAFGVIPLGIALTQMMQKQVPLSRAKTGHLLAGGWLYVQADHSR